MKKFIRAIAIATAIGAPAAVAIAPSAQAANADAAVITGAGTISPGLTVTPGPQTVNFGGQAIVEGTNAGTYTCAFSGGDLAGSYAEGAGTVHGTCGPISLSLCVFVRVGAAVGVVCAEADAGPKVKFAGGAFVFVPDQTPSASNPTPTVTSYTLAGAAVYADAP